MNYESEISTLKAFSRVISLEEAVAYTTCSQAGLSKLLFLGKKVSFKDLRGDVASWEKEDGWETSGEVNVVTLRCLTF